ncbi:unnamed protein product [Haemonchus placei]|uniref:Secreted protein n=1 Tax=Haemonchus placei TaxID=6290 RepID=A0A0N4W7K4_HAEPC|nr:unnamed protein product [Haemonchus placei]
MFFTLSYTTHLIISLLLHVAGIGMGIFVWHLFPKNVSFTLSHQSSSCQFSITEYANRLGFILPQYSSTNSFNGLEVYRRSSFNHFSCILFFELL